MSNMMLGYQNAVPTATLTASGAVAGLGLDQLQNDQGSPSTAWQCPGTSAALAVDTGNPAATWRALCLARTNFTPAAQVDWRIGTADAMANPTRGLGAISTGTYTTYNGTTYDESNVTSRGRKFTNTAPVAQAAYQYSYADGTCTAGTSYTLVAWFRRENGGTVAGYSLVLEWVSAAGAHISYGGLLPMTGIPQGVGWNSLTITDTAPAGAVTLRALFAMYTGDGSVPFTYVVGDCAIYANAAYESGNTTGVQPGYGQLVIVSPALVTGQSCRIDISDPTNPDGFLNIPLIYAGPAFQPARNWDYGSSPGRGSQSIAAASRAGGVITRTDWTKRTFDLSLSSIRAADVPAFEDASRFGLSGGNVLFIPNPDSPRVNREAILGQLTPASGFTYPQKSRDARGWRATIMERL